MMPSTFCSIVFFLSTTSCYNCPAVNVFFFFSFCCWNLNTSAQTAANPLPLTSKGNCQVGCKMNTSDLDVQHCDLNPLQLDTSTATRADPRSSFWWSHWDDVAGASRNLAGRLSRRSWSLPAALGSFRTWQYAILVKICKRALAKRAYTTDLLGFFRQHHACNTHTQKESHYSNVVKY